mmetsp:Transcript_26127/g.62963  ORF Transcript_26127/g.62963 Transcript_26127/m.62963 type:complete len:203 (-) Transcript_26127:414-1022(-)
MVLSQVAIVVPELEQYRHEVPLHLQEHIRLRHHSPTRSQHQISLLVCLDFQLVYRSLPLQTQGREYHLSASPPPLSPRLPVFLPLSVFLQNLLPLQHSLHLVQQTVQQQTLDLCLPTDHHHRKAYSLLVLQIDRQRVAIPNLQRKLQELYNVDAVNACSSESSSKLFELSLYCSEGQSMHQSILVLEDPLLQRSSAQLRSKV